MKEATLTGILLMLVFASLCMSLGRILENPDVRHPEQILVLWFGALCSATLVWRHFTRPPL